jgi:hypothetical protein
VTTAPRQRAEFYAVLQSRFVLAEIVVVLGKQDELEVGRGKFLSDDLIDKVLDPLLVWPSPSCSVCAD